MSGFDPWSGTLNDIKPLIIFEDNHISTYEPSLAQILQKSVLQKIVQRMVILFFILHSSYSRLLRYFHHISLLPRKKIYQFFLIYFSPLLFLIYITLLLRYVLDVIYRHSIHFPFPCYFLVFFFFY